MEVMVAVQSGTPLRALIVLLKNGIFARRGMDYYAIWGSYLVLGVLM